jgi:hypothetical protein
MVSLMALLVRRSWKMAFQSLQFRACSMTRMMLTRFQMTMTAHRSSTKEQKERRY